MRRAFLTLLWCSIGWLASGTGVTLAAEPENADIRVLIDISGSMKQNDPQNLRRPALRMLVGLMQPGTKAGVWTFAQYAAELVQPAVVDDAWKQRALAASEKINSPGMYTDIERVLQRAIRDWEGTAVSHRRNLLLLTDGVVDVSKDATESAVSRKRILEQLLPQIRAMDAKVHTIALSARADHVLLEQLARDTGGWYQQVETANELQRVFLKLFEQAGRPTGVPLKDNKFRVDNTIREATVLIFQPEGAAEPRLTSPSGSSFTRESAPPNVSWHQDTGYELITMRDPEAGEWSLTAEVDPDNRVMVVTDLKLQVSDLPARIAVGDVLPVSAHLTNDGRLITRREFLDLVEMRAETLTDEGLAPQPLNDKGRKGDVKSGDGRYSMNLVEREPRAEMDLVVAAESSTFLREQRHMLAVLEPASVRVIKDDAGGLSAELVIDRVVMRADDMRFGIWQLGPDGAKQKLDMVLKGQGVYRAELTDAALPVYGAVEGVSRLGNPISREYGPVYAPGAEPAPTPAQPTAPVPESKPAQQAEPAMAAPAAVEAPADAAEAVQEDEAGWVMPTIVFGGVNLLLLIGGVVFWLLWRRRRGKEDFDLVDDDDDEVPEAAQTAAEEAAEKA